MGRTKVADIPLHLSICDSDRVHALVDGTVETPGIDLHIETPSIEESIIDMLRHRRWDAAEMSFSAALIAAERGEPAFSILPIFPSRYFRHSALFVNTSAGIEHPYDLRGKRVAVPAYARLAAAVWMRGILEDDYGLAPSDVTWVVPEPLPVGIADMIPVDLPPDVKIEEIAPDPWLDLRLAEGDVDALLTARLPRPFIEGDPRVARLFPSPRDVELDYFRRTGIFPPMHVIVVRRELYGADPWIGSVLFNAFVEAKRLCLQQAYEIDVARYSIAWWVSYLEAERSVLGDDPWTHGLIPNRHTVETFVDYCYRQALLTQKLDPEEIFPPNLLDTAG
jgi:4,5-dihydroxyphthalate decarboxylase